ncbi:MAG: hypothetical protein GY879_05425 [Planctomycetes bacterium]|nr:hypothetical protein [Planctomycetota bacterium]MCP4860212.1 hypothetical protein [Planctomycetota bacterium]
MSLRTILACTALGLMASCSLPTMDVVRDFSAIHNSTDWQPQSPAMMSVPPEFYLGNPTARASGSGLYDVEDHRALELAMIEQINGVDLETPAAAIEVCSWMLIALSQDDHSEARTNATYVLLRVTGTWAARSDVSIKVADPNADLTAAIRALDAASDHASFIAAAEELRLTSMPDVITGVRVLNALGRLSEVHGLASGNGDHVVMSAALDIVMQCFEIQQGDVDPAVANAIKVSLDHLQKTARQS